MEEKVQQTQGVQVSVIVPVHDMEGKLSYLKSWLTKESLEILKVTVVNDRSATTQTPELDEYMAYLSCENLEYIVGDFGSAGKARNAGLERLGKTTWVSFWDADDVPNVGEFLEMLESAEDMNFEICVGGYEIFSGIDGTRISEQVMTGKQFRMKLPRTIGIWRWAFKSSRISGIRFKDFRMGEDQVFLFEVNPKPDETFFCASLIYKYTKFREGQATQNKKTVLEISKTQEFLWNTHKKTPRDLSIFQKSVITYVTLSDFKNGKLRRRRHALSRLLRLFLQNPVLFAKCVL